MNIFETKHGLLSQKSRFRYSRVVELSLENMISSAINALLGTSYMFETGKVGEERKLYCARATFLAKICIIRKGLLAQFKSKDLETLI